MIDINKPWIYNENNNYFIWYNQQERAIMKEFKVIEVKRSILEDNDADAALLREELKAQGTFLLNLISSPGAGKTTM